MWWEILPSLGVVYAFLLAPHGVNWAMNKMCHNGKSTGRNWRATPYFDDYVGYLRDVRITGSEYIPRGLESIPDEKSE